MPNLLAWARPAVARFSRSRVFRRVGPTVMPPLEAGIAFLTRGRVQMSGLIVPSLVVHTVGAKSGLERSTTLMYCPDGDTMLVTGSNFARDGHPAWTTNLLRTPAAAVSIRGIRLPVHATLVAGADRERAWLLIERQWPRYREYERQSGRTLRIFRLTPQ
jgi:deazaflavin-dependent oxidoreductase (nitroreductase family)